MRTLPVLALFLGLLAGAAAPVAADSGEAPDSRWTLPQESESGAPPTLPLEDPLSVHLITAEPGAAVWERFGHNGILIRDARSGDEWVWEWGVFSFSQAGFMGRLLRGTMLYTMQPQPLDYMVGNYAAAGRRVWAQELALTPEQKAALQLRIARNYQTENRDYIYNYYLDNCSTRVRDHLDAVLGGRIEVSTTGIETDQSWRDHTLRLLRPMPWAWAGVQFVLGRPGDTRISAWEEMFLPMRLRDRLAAVTVETPEGERPLVVNEVLLTPTIPESTLPNEQPVWWPIAGLIGLALAALSGLGLRGRLRRGEGRAIGTGLLLIGWGLLVGLAGTILFLSWPLTDHTFWRWNENLLLASPLTFAWIAVGIGLLRGRTPTGATAVVVHLLIGLAVVGVILAIVPGGQGTLSTTLVLASVPLGVAFALKSPTRAEAPPR